MGVVCQLHALSEGRFALLDEEPWPGRASTEEECVRAASAERLARSLNGGSRAIFCVYGVRVAVDDLTGVLACFLRYARSTKTNRRKPTGLTSISTRAFWSRSLFRATIDTCAPALVNAIARARPAPEDPPVTKQC